MFDDVSIICFLACYVIAFALECLRIQTASRVNWIIMLLFSAAGFVAHTAYLIVRSQQREIAPLLNSPHDWFLVLAWLCMLLYLYKTWSNKHLALGVFSYPPVLLMILAATFASDETNQLVDHDKLKYWGLLHASFLVIGILGVMLSFITSLMYLYQHSRLKHKRSLSKGLELPNLENLARMNRWAVILSVPMLSLGMATGIFLSIYAKSLDKQHLVQLSDPVIIGNGIVWLVMFGFFLRLLFQKGTSAKHVAWMTVWACGFMMLTLIGLQLIVGTHGSVRNPPAMEPNGTQIENESEPTATREEAPE